jgi:hypothetical protein
MGSCSSMRRSNANEHAEKNLTLTPKDIEHIRNSWKIVVKEGLGKYGVNMMIRY